MGLDATGWTPTSAGDLIAAARAEWDAAAGVPLDYSPGTWEGGATVAFGVVAARVEADAAVILDALSPETASGGNLDRIGAFRGIPRRAATFSRYIFYPVIASGYPSVTIPGGTQVRDSDRQLWAVTVDTTVTSTSDPVAVQAVDSGPVTVDGAQTLQTATPVSGLSAMTYDPADGDVFTIGKNAETAAEYATVAVFPAGSKNIRFVGCNLDNVALPPGSVVDDVSCCRRQWVLRADLGHRHWPVDKGKLAARDLYDTPQAAVVAELRKSGVSIDVAAVEAACPAAVAMDGHAEDEAKPVEDIKEN